MTKKGLEAIAAGVMALVLGCVGLVFWAGNQRNAHQGPAFLAEDARQRVWVVAARELFILGPDGTLQSRARLKDLGLDEPVTSLATLPEGGAIAGNRFHGLLYFLGPDGRLERTLDPATTSAGHLRDGYALRAAADRLYVAHTGYHRVLVLDRAGKVLHRAGSESGTDGLFHFPNDILPADGKLYVPDTNHHEIEVLDAELQRAREPIPVPRLGGARWPLAIAPLPEGRFAVTVLSDGMRYGGVGIVDGEGKLVRRLELQEDAEPLRLLAREDDLLVCDQHNARFQVRRFDLAGNFAGEFGDAAFLAAMREGSARHRMFGTLRDVGQWGALAFGVLLLAVYRRSREAEDPVVESALALPPLPPRDWSAEGRLILAAVLPILPGLVLFEAIRWLEPVRELGLPAFALAAVLLAAGAVHSVRSSHAPRHAAARRAMLDRQVRARLRAYREWGANERVLASGRANWGLKLVYFYVTPTRIVLLPPSGSRPLEVIPITGVLGIDEVPPMRLRRWIHGDAVRALALRVSGQGRIVTLEVLGPEQFAALRDGIRTGSASPVTELAAREKAVPPSRPAWSSVALSALLPGLGHLNQRRHLPGAVWIVAFGSLSWSVGLDWFVELKRIAEVDDRGLWLVTVVAGVLWLVALLDVVRVELERRG